MRSLSNDELNEISGGWVIGAYYLGMGIAGAVGLGAGLGAGSWISNAFSK